jgi:iron complex outermembrane receptor protein
MGVVPAFEPLEDRHACRGLLGSMPRGTEANLATFTPLWPEEVSTYEVDVKSEWFDRRLLVNAAAFHIDYRNLQFHIFATVPDGSIDLALGNIRAEMQEAEIEGNLAVRENTLVGGNLSWLDAAYAKGTAGVVSSAGAPILGDEL